MMKRTAAFITVLGLICLAPVARASMVDLSTCVMEAGQNRYIYGMVDKFGRVGPYALTVKDMFAVGACTGEGRLYGVVNDWSLCDFKGPAATANIVSSMQELSLNADVQDMFFGIIASQIQEKDLVDLFNMKGLEKYRTYPQWQQTLTGIVYRKGTKALQYHALLKTNVMDTKGPGQSLIEQLDKMQKCTFMKDIIQKQKSVSSTWSKGTPIPPGSKIQKFEFVRSTPDSNKKLGELLKKADQKFAQTFEGFFKDSGGSYMFSKLDYNQNGLDDYIVFLLDEAYNLNNMTYYMVFHDEGKKIDGFPANDVSYADKKLVINGFMVND